MSKVYWSINQAMTYNPYILYVVGERGVGKSYSTKVFAIKRFIKYKEQFIYLRRYPKELKKLDKFFDDVAKEFPDHEFKVKGRNLYIDDEVCGFAAPLSQQHYLKSTPFPKVCTLIFDEFIIDEGGFKRYIDDEVVEFYEIIQTIFRQRDLDGYNIRIIMLANALTINNPYFMFKDIVIEEGKRFTIVEVDEDDGTPLHLVENVNMPAYRERSRKSKFGKAIRGTNYEKYAIDNEMLRDRTPFVATKPNNAQNYFTIVNKGNEFSIWADHKKDQWYVVYGMINDTLPRFVINYDEHNSTSLYPKRNNYRLKAIEVAFRNGELFFDTERTFARFKDVLWLIGCK